MNAQNSADATQAGRSPIAQRYGGLSSNVIVMGIAACALLMNTASPGSYVALSQEDHLVEWATVWAFVLAALAFVAAAQRAWKRGKGLQWFTLSMGLFCFVVAMEEMSWGQRLFMYRPPAYFLEANFQQEFNLHNVVESDLRQLLMQIVILGYGVVLPLLSLPASGGAFLAALRIVPPRPVLIPAFVGTSLMYALYPLEYTGEWVELMLGLCLLCAALGAGHRIGGASARTIAISAVATACAAWATLWMTQTLFAASPDLLAAARAEAAALATDFAHERVATRCGVHKRVHTFAREYGQNYLYEGRFASLLLQRNDAQRGRYFLDPWNMPWWIRHECRDGNVEVFVYSFGPNRRRDSTTRSAGDDIAAAVTPWPR